jgi:hypothetical protein
MNSLAKTKIHSISHHASVIRDLLEHFGSVGTREDIEMLSVAADFAFADALLFQSFEFWQKKEIDDEALLFQVKHFFETKDQNRLPEEKRNLTGNARAIQGIKVSADENFAILFGKKVSRLAAAKGLHTNEKLGVFLNMEPEQARGLREGKHKPQRKTIARVAEAFGVSIESFFE